MITYLLALQIAVAADTTSRPQFEREVRFTPEVWAYLADQWNEVQANQVERAYCLFVMPTFRMEAPADTIDLVIGVFRSVALHAEQGQVGYSCGPKLASLHVHTPATCETRSGPCTLGGPGAYLCYPSQQDVDNIRTRGNRYGIVQCSRHGFVVYYAAAGAGGVP